MQRLSPLPHFQHDSGRHECHRSALWDRDSPQWHTGHPQGALGPAVPMGQSLPTRSDDVPKHHHGGGDASSVCCPHSAFPELCGVSTALGRGSFIPTLWEMELQSQTPAERPAQHCGSGGTAPSCSLTNIPALPAARPDKSSTRVCCAHIYIYLYICFFFHRNTESLPTLLESFRRNKNVSGAARGCGGWEPERGSAVNALFVFDPRLVNYASFTYLATGVFKCGCCCCDDARNSPAQPEPRMGTSPKISLWCRSGRVGAVGWARVGVSTAMG